MYLSIILDNDQRDAYLLYFTIYLLHASTCSEHYMLIIRRLNCIDAASGIVLWISGRLVDRLGENYAAIFYLLSISHLYLDITVLLKNLKVYHTFNKFPTSYAAQTLISVFIRTSYLTLFCANPSSQTATTPLAHGRVRPELFPLRLTTVYFLFCLNR